MATKATHRQLKTFARAEKPRCFCLLFLSVVIFGVSKGSAVPRLATSKPYSLTDVSAKRRTLSELEELPLAEQILSFNPLSGGRRWLQSLYGHRDLPSDVHSSSVALKPQRIARKQILGFVVKSKHKATNLHRVPLSEEDTEREEGHADGNSHEEGGSADGAEEEDGDEEGTEDDDEEDEPEEEPSEDDEDKHADVREKSSSKSAKVYPRANGEGVEKQTTQNVEEISRTIRTAADEVSVSEAHVDTAEEQGSHDEGSAEQTSSSGKESESEKGGSEGRGQFRGVPGGSSDGTNVTHISYMLYKIVKTYDIKTVVDIPCRHNLQWFPELLHQIEFEVVGFKYICVDEGADSDSNLRDHFSEAASAKFLSIPPTESDRLPKSDLVFSYDGPQKWGVRKTWTFFTGLRKVRPKYIIVTNNPGQMNNDEEETLNVRKQPFHFAQAMRVISNVDTRTKAKQLVFYETENIREGF